MISISLAEGVAIPHTIYDTVQNKAYVSIGTSRDTSEFACDSIRQWWNNHGSLLYPNATSILRLMDGGGSNSFRHSIFKQDLQALVDKLGIDIRVAHYPPYIRLNGIQLSTEYSRTSLGHYKVWY
jgi:hypothetical protein